MTVPTRPLPTRPPVAAPKSEQPVTGGRRNSWNRYLPTGEQVVFGCLLMAVLHAPTALILAMGFGLARLAGWLVSRQRRRRLLEEIESELPDALSLMQVAVVAGAGPRQALLSLERAVANESDNDDSISALHKQLSAVGHALRLGFGISDAFGIAFEQRIEQVDRISSLLIRSERDGQALAEGLHRLSAELRRRRMVSLDARAQRATVSLLFPLVFCILPAFLLLVVVPVIITVFNGLQPVVLSR